MLAGPDPLWDGIGYKLDLPPPRAEALRDFRVLVIDTHPLCPTAADVRAPLSTLAENLARSGCTVLRAHPAMPDLARTTRVYAQLLMATMASELPPEIRARAADVARTLPSQAHSIGAEKVRGIMMDYPTWVETGYIRDSLRMQWQALFREIDVLLCPPMPTVAFPHDHSPLIDRKIDVDGTVIRYGDQVAWAGIATLTGLPSTTAPAGWTLSGLPVGIQVIGGYLDDLTTIAFAAALEREFGGFVPPPGFA
jgi:amidase